jgi:hypothetical protein
VGPSRREGCFDWQPRVQLSSAQSTPDGTEILRRLEATTKSTLLQLGFREAQSQPSLDDRVYGQTFRDSKDEFFVVVDGRLDDANTLLEVHLILFVNQKLSLW